MAILLGILICVNHVLTAPFRPNLALLVPSFLLPLVLLAVSPIPWQWSGDARLKPGPLRGTLQGLLFNGAWMGTVLVILRHWGPSEFPRGAEPPGLFAARMGLWVFACLAVMGFGWLWAEKEVADARGRMLGDLVQELSEMQIQDRKRQEEREQLIRELREALNEVRTLNGLIPICASCKKVRDDQGYWQQVERYIERHTPATFTHGLCPDCVQQFKAEVKAITEAGEP